jgi:hypothetical protein
MRRLLVPVLTPRPVSSFVRSLEAEDRVVSAIESDYLDYESAKDSEGGLHSGRKSPSWRLVGTGVLFLASCIAGLIALALIPNR